MATAKTVQTWLVENRIDSTYSINNVATPVALFDEMLSKIDNVASKSILSLNIEVAILLYAKYEATNVTCIINNLNAKQLLEDVGIKTIFIEEGKDALDVIKKLNMKFDIVIGNPPYTLGGADNGKGSKSAIPAFLRLGMKLAEEVYFVIPAGFATAHSDTQKKWASLKRELDMFGVHSIEALDQKKYFPNVTFNYASLTRLKRGVGGKVEDFNIFGGWQRPDTTDVPRISTQRGHSISKESPELLPIGDYKIITSLSNNNTNELTYKYINRRLTTVKSPWFVCIQEQSGVRIWDAVVVDNTNNNVMVTANVYPLHCSTEEEAIELAQWVVSEDFNKLLRKCNGGNRLHRVQTLSLLPAKRIDISNIDFSNTATNVGRYK